MQPKQLLPFHRARVNVKSLAAEARIIRHELERIRRRSQSLASNGSPELNDARQQARRDLLTHRRGRLREQSRLAQLALAFIRGRPYAQVEAKTDREVGHYVLQTKLKRFGVEVEDYEVRNWLDGNS